MSQTLSGILAELFDRHSDQLRKVLANQQTILANQETAQADLDAIKAFLGITNPNPSETQQVIDAQTAALKQMTADLQAAISKKE